MDDAGARMLQEWNDRIEKEERTLLWNPGKTPDFKDEYGQNEPSLVAFFPKQWNSFKKPGSAVLVCAGGGFSIKAPHEGWPFCEWLNENGIAAFLLDYRLNPYTLPTILGDAKRAMRYIRYNAEKFQISPDKIGVMGFSAGGQITVSLSTLFDEGDPAATDPIDRVSCRPNVQIPCYPAVTILHREFHEDTSDEWRRYVRTLLGEGADDAMIRSYSPEANVKENTPPAFLWGTCDDFLYQHWPLYIQALKEKNIPFEQHIFSSGPHGMGMAKEHPTAKVWTVLCMHWLKEVIGF